MPTIGLDQPLEVSKDRRPEGFEWANKIHEHKMHTQTPKVRLTEIKHPK